MTLIEKGWVYDRKGARTPTPYRTLGGADEIHLRMEEDCKKIRFIVRLYVTARGISWYPKGAKDPANPDRYPLTWEQLSDLTRRQTR